MGATEILRWQWETYPANHRDRRNLLIHLVAVPMFLAGNLALAQGIWQLAPGIAIGGALTTVLGIFLQGRGHKLEAVAPIPFSSPANALARIFLEQWITFPRYVLSGGWLRAFAGE